MKKILLAFFVSSILLSACETITDTDTSSLDLISSNTVISSSNNNKIKLSYDKKDSKPKYEDSTFRISEDPEIFFSAVNPGDVGTDEKSMANIALNDMNKAKTLYDGTSIGFKAATILGDKGNYNANLTVKCFKGLENSEEYFKVLALGLNAIVKSTPNTTLESSNLVLKMMNASRTWKSGANLGFNALEIIGNTDNKKVKAHISKINNRAKYEYYPKDKFKIIKQGLEEIKFYI